MNILIIGGAGFIGSELSQAFINDRAVFCLDKVPSKISGVISLVANLPLVPEFSSTDGEKLFMKKVAAHEEFVVVNLVGKNIFGRFTNKHKKELYDSRIKTTAALFDWCLKMNMNIIRYIGASGAGYYGNQPNEMLIEDSKAGTSFLSKLCVDWEHAHKKFHAFTHELIILRLGNVMGKGGFLGALLPLFKNGLGGALGDGDFHMPWIAMEDLVSICFAATSGKLPGGIYNATAGEPITNKNFSFILARVLHKKLFMNVPLFTLRLVFRSFADEMTSDQQVLNNKIKNYVKFKGEDIEEVLKKVVL
jgi:uncharacterized protein (TIGR01777 family)